MTYITMSCCPRHNCNDTMILSTCKGLFAISLAIRINIIAFWLKPSQWENTTYGYLSKASTYFSKTSPNSQKTWNRLPIKTKLTNRELNNYIAKHSPHHDKIRSSLIGSRVLQTLKWIFMSWKMAVRLMIGSYIKICHKYICRHTISVIIWSPVLKSNIPKD